MIELYAVRTDELPETDRLMAALRLHADAKRAAWENRKESAVRESVAGLLLLQVAMHAHGWAPDAAEVLAAPGGRLYLRGVAADFNISHTAGLAVCAFSAVESVRVGVDAECMRIRPADAMKRVAERWFSAAEQEVFRNTPTEEVFLRIWTGKEAIVKQSGEGIAGLKRADTVGGVPGLRLYTYPVDHAVITLCGPDGCRAPDGVRFLVTEELNIM